MNARQAKLIAREWVETNLDAWPGLRAAHLVGGITTMADDEPFPAHKDLDVHLIFDEGSPALQAPWPYMNVIEVSFGGVSIEAGVKSCAEYGSAEAVLTNPEIAHHRTVDSILHDHCGLLRDLQEAVRREYPRRRWVLARLDHERSGMADALGLRPMVAARLGASGEVNILGYATTFLAATLAEAEKPVFAARQSALLAELGLDTPDARSAAYTAAARLSDRVFALAEETVASHPGVTD